MPKKQGRRQRVRMALIFIMMLLFPVLLNYMSPYLIIQSASEGIINGSFILFGFLFVSSLFVGRLWCGWACPGAGLQEPLFAAQNKPAAGGRWNWIKWGIWFVWIGTIAAVAISAGGYRAVNPLYMNEDIVSLTHPFTYIIYYFVLGLTVVLSLAAGRRGFCHYVCWMAPFMIIGRKIRNLVAWPSLRLKADASKCKDCMTCTKNCPMSLDVNGMVQKEKMENSECILCGTCVDGCPQNVIRYSFSSGK